MNGRPVLPADVPAGWLRSRGVSPLIAGLVIVTVLAQAAALLAVNPSWLDAVVLMVLDGLGVVYGVRGSRRGANVVAWLLIAGGRALSILANVFLALSAADGHSSWWWIGTVCGLVMYGALAAGVLSVPAQRLHGRQRIALVTEGLIVLGGGFMFVWYFIIAPIIENHAHSRVWLLTLGFPIGDLMLLIAVTAVVLRDGFARAPRSLVLMISGLTLYLIGDLAFNAIGLDGVHTTGSRPATLCIVFGSLLMTMSAMIENAKPTLRTQNALAPVWTTYFPYAAVGLGFVLMLVVTLRDNNFLPWGGLVVGLVVMSGAVAARQILSLRDSREQIVTDSLTGLSNRGGLHAALERALRRDQPAAVLLIDLDGFKRVNDVHGHAAGDTVLTEFAYALRSTTRSSDVAARIGGDEFVVLLNDVRSPGEAVAAARRILAVATADPVRIGGHEITTRASIGIALSEDGDTVKDLLHRGDVAMYQAKRDGTHGFALYDPGMLDRRGDDAALGEDLETAVSAGELRVLYQPMVDLATGRPRAVEALVRWQHPTRGLVSPLDFIPVAEQTGAITGIGLHVLEQACRQVRAWQVQLPRGSSFYASVNLSPRQLQEPTLVADVLAVLERTGLPPTDLVLEVTESAIVDEETAIPALEALRSHGIRIAIDDFGTGYSSLQYLTRLPVDILKIDRSFVAKLNGTAQGSAVTEAVIRLSQALHLRIVAEGIETVEQADELMLFGCDTGQGFLYARPLPATEVQAMIAAITPAETPAGT